MGDWMVVGFLLVLTVILVVWLVMIEQDRHRSAAKVSKVGRASRVGGAADFRAKNARERVENPKFIEPMDSWEFPENDGWEYPFPAGEFIRSWYLNMDVMEEGVSELGSRYRILKDNDTGVLYFSDRGGMTPLVKDYRNTRYA